MGDRDHQVSSLLLHGSLVGEHSLDLLGHPIEGRCEVGELVAPGYNHMRPEVTGRNLLCGPPECPDPLCHVETDDGRHAKRDDEKRHEQQGKEMQVLDLFEHEKRGVEDGDDRSDARHGVAKAHFERHAREEAHAESNTNDPNPDRDAP